MLWKAAHAQNPSDVAELKLFSKEELANLPPLSLERLIASYRKRLIVALAVKGGKANY